VLRRKVAVEGASELGVIYHRRGTAFTRMTAILQHNGVLGIAADGLTGSHFVDVPYLGGRVAWPTGPAWLSLRSGAPILLVLSLLEGLARHRITLLPPLYCQGRSRAAVADLVRAYAALLDEYTRRYPWAWWPWRRLDVRPDADGVLWLQVGERPEEKQGHYTPELEAQPEPI
jgi:lauroyl/myristoyl acyltransferase